MVEEIKQITSLHHDPFKVLRWCCVFTERFWVGRKVRLCQSGKKKPSRLNKTSRSSHKVRSLPEKIFHKLPNRNFPSPGNEVTEASCKFLLTSNSLSLALVREHRQQTATTQSWNRDGTGELGHIWPISWRRDSDFVWRGMWNEMWQNCYCEEYFPEKIHTDVRDMKRNIPQHTVHVPVGRYCEYYQALYAFFSNIWCVVFKFKCWSSVMPEGDYTTSCNNLGALNIKASVPSVMQSQDTLKFTQIS